MQRQATLAGLRSAMRCTPLVLSVAACTYPEKQFAYSCFGAPPPTTADLFVRLQGDTIDPLERKPLAGVMVSFLDRNMSTIDGPITTDVNGGFAFTLPTNGTPVDGLYFAATASDRIPTFLALSRPVTQDDLTIEYAVLSTMQASSVAVGALGMPFTQGSGSVFVTVRDCNDQPISGATVASVPAGTVRYFDAVQPSMTRTATDGGGVALVANLPPGNVTLTVTADDRTFPARTVIAVADSFIQTIIQP